jgi:predicted deacylase
VSKSLLTAVHDGEGIRVPVIELSGTKDGPILTVVAGVHGAEYVGIEASIRLSQEIQPEQLRGTLRIVPICNLPGFLGRCEVQCPIDGKNLNRVFPGNPDNSYTDHLAYLVYENVVKGSDCVLNIHGGDIFEELVPYAGVGTTGNEAVDSRSQELGLIYDLPFLLETRNLPGSVPGGSSLNKAAQSDGIPSILAEAGGRGLVEEEFVQTHLKGMRNVLKWMNMIEGKVKSTVKTRVMATDFWRIAHEGVCYPELSLSEFVKKGQRIGVVKDWFGDTLQVLTAPHDAYVVANVITPAARKDAIIYQVAY